MQVRLARELLTSCKALNRTIAELDQELGQRVCEVAPALLELPGCAAVTAAKLLAEIGPIDRFKTETAQTFRVWSTLDGRTVLPARVHWIAHTNLPAARVSKADFLINGKLRWTESQQPYTFGEDDGYLVRSWLAPGRHRFTVRVTDTSNHSASHAVSLRVPAGQQPPHQLSGRWQRTVTAADQQEAGYASPPPAGRWSIVFDEVGIWELDPFGSALVTEYRAHGGFWRPSRRSRWLPTASV